MPSKSRLALSPQLGRLLDASEEIAVAGGSDGIGTEHLLLALLRDPLLIPESQLRALRLEPAVVLARLASLSLRISNAEWLIPKR